MNKNDSIFMSCLGLFLYAIIIAVVGTLLNGWVLSVLWGWFMVLVFGLPVLSVGYAIGIALVIRYIMPSNYQKADTKDKSVLLVCFEAFSMAIFAPLLSLGMGWIVLQFVR